MPYFVIGPGGQKYGPAEASLLNQWIAEGRLFPNSVLEDAQTGAQSSAATVPGLAFPNLTPPPMAMPHHSHAPTYSGDYTPPQYAEDGPGQALLGVGLGVLSIVLSFLLGWGSFLCWVGGLGFSWQGRKERPALAYLGIALNIVAAVIWVYMLIREQQEILAVTR